MLIKSLKVRKAVLQLAFVGTIVLALVVAVLEARENFIQQGIGLTLDFLWKATGWEMSFSVLPTTRSDPYWWYLLVGLINTLFLGIISLTGATLVGGVVGLIRISTNKALQLIGTIYVETFRNIPFILQIFFWYSLTTTLPKPRDATPFVGIFMTSRGLYLPGIDAAPWAVAGFWLAVFATLGTLTWFSASSKFRRLPRARRLRTQLGIAAGGAVVALLLLLLGHDASAGWFTVPEVAGLNVRGGYRIQPELYALAFAIAVAGGANIGEIFRGGFKAVGHSQSEAAHALGLSPWQAFSRVRFPLAARAMLPSLANQYIWLVKATTLGLVVGYSDLFAVIVSSITQSGQTFEFMAILMTAFILINFTMANIFNRINEAVKLKGH